MHYLRQLFLIITMMISCISSAYAFNGEIAVRTINVNNDTITFKIDSSSDWVWDRWYNLVDSGEFHNPDDFAIIGNYPTSCPEHHIIDTDSDQSRSNASRLGRGIYKMKAFRNGVYKTTLTIKLLGTKFLGDSILTYDGNTNKFYHLNNTNCKSSSKGNMVSSISRYHENPGGFEVQSHNLNTSWAGNNVQLNMDLYSNHANTPFTNSQLANISYEFQVKRKYGVGSWETLSGTFSDGWVDTWTVGWVYGCPKPTYYKVRSRSNDFYGNPGPWSEWSSQSRIVATEVDCAEGF